MACANRGGVRCGYRHDAPLFQAQVEKKTEDERIAHEIRIAYEKGLTTFAGYRDPELEPR